MTATRVIEWGRGLRRDFLMRNFFTFAKHSGICPDINEAEYGDICEFLESCIPNTPKVVAWRLETGRIHQPPGRYCQQYNDFQMPRRTFKTSLAKALCAYAQELDPDIRIVLGRATADMAESTLEGLKDDLTRNETLRQVFGNIKGRYSTWTTQKITRSDRSPGIKEPTVDTVGLGQSQTGQHPDFVILDDLVHEGNFESVTQMYAARKLVDSYDPILESWGSLLLMGTRWGDNDIHGYVAERDNILEDQGKSPKFRHFILGAYKDIGTGELRFPTVLPKAFLDRQQDIIDPKMFSAWYMNKARAEGEDIFTMAYIQYFDGEMVTGPFAQLSLSEGEPLRARFGKMFPISTVLTCDPAPTVGPRSDFTGVVVAGFDEHANYWVLHADEFKKLPFDRLQYILYLCRQYDPATIALENGDLDAVLLQMRLDEMGLRGKVVKFDPKMDRKKITATGLSPRGRTSKASQIEAMEPTLRARRVFFARGTTAPLIRRLQSYPYVDHDDVLDAFSMLKAYESPSSRRAMDDPEKIFEMQEKREYALEGLRFDGTDLEEPSLMARTPFKKKPGAWAGR